MISRYLDLPSLSLGEGITWHAKGLTDSWSPMALTIGLLTYYSRQFSGLTLTTFLSLHPPGIYLMGFVLSDFLMSGVKIVL